MKHISHLLIQDYDIRVYSLVTILLEYVNLLFCKYLATPIICLRIGEPSSSICISNRYTILCKVRANTDTSIGIYVINVVHSP